jgi:LPS export ABC transporter protein LptC
MDKKMKIFSAAAVLFFAAVMAWAFFTSPEETKVAEEVRPTKSLSYENNTIVEEKDGKKVWEITAAAIQLDPRTNDTVMQDIKGKFYRDDGTVIDLTSPEGIYNSREGHVKFMKSVEVKSADGAYFKADAAEWNSNKKTFLAEGNITAERDDTVLTGDKMESDIDFEHIKVSGNAKIVKGAKKK